MSKGMACLSLLLLYMLDLPGGAHRLLDDHQALDPLDRPRQNRCEGLTATHLPLLLGTTPAAMTKSPSILHSCPQTWEARTGSMTAPPSNWSWKETTWITLRRVSARSIERNWQCFSHTAPPAPSLARCPGSREIQQRAHGMNYRKKQDTTFPTKGMPTGIIGKMAMPADIATQAKGEDDCQQCGKTTTAAWRAHSLRAQAFQKPGRPKTNPSASKASRRRAQHGQTCLHFHALLNWVFGAPGAKSAPWRCRATALLTRWPFLAKQLAGASTPKTTRKPLKLHHPTPGSNRNNSPPKSSVAGHSGPKSGGSSLYKTALGFVLLQSTAGARVSSTAVVEEGPGLWDLPGPGKQHGQALGSGLTLGSRLTFAAKRAYRRARNRAMTSLEGGTYYKGRWHTQDTLRASAITHHTPVQRNKALRQSPKTSRHPKIRSFSWNTGGLSAPSFQELVAWLDLEDRFEVVILQETHWRDSTDFKSGMVLHPFLWLCF